MKLIQYIFYFISSLRTKLFQNKILKTHAFNIPIISIGNISMGGSGKTPMTDWLISYLLSIDKKPCVVTRGYGRISKKMVVLNSYNKNSYSVDDLGDEPFALWKKHPSISMVVGNNKVKSIKAAHKISNCDVIILDDGFQSLYINRDLDIVMINAQKNQTLMREKMGSLQRADVVIWKDSTKDKLFESECHVNNVPSGSLKLITKNILTFDLGETPPPPLFAVCGIANPKSFMNSLKQENISINGFIHYPDHYNYADKDMKNIILKMKDCNAKVIITTSKDYYKLNEINNYDVNIIMTDFSIDFIDNRMNFNNKSDFLKLVNQKLQ